MLLNQEHYENQFNLSDMLADDAQDDGNAECESTQKNSKDGNGSTWQEQDCWANQDVVSALLSG